jgi:hypothetical protein
MTKATGPTPSFQYFTAQANQAFCNVKGHVSSAFNKLLKTFSHLGNAALSVSYGLRQEVPFERWFYDYGFQTPLDKTEDLIKARAWAIIASCEGVIRTTAEAVSYLFSLVLEPKERHRHLDVMKAQMQGLSLSLLAILSPNDAKRKAHNKDGTPLIGASFLDWQWGSPYIGTRDAPFWHIECRHYHWFD